jgi:hemerythrin-like domain-containing protein
MKITEALLSEHLVFHNMFDYLETALPRLKTLAEVKALAALMESLLKAHSDTEDDLFLGPLDHCFEQIGQRDGFLEEHREIDDSLRTLRQVKDFKKARQLLLGAVMYSRKHFDKEERIVFPMAERVLNAKTLSDLGRSWMDQRARGVKEVQSPKPKV